MIIDSHAHYSVFQYNGQFPFLDGKDGVLFRNHGERELLFNRMQEQGISLCIEPSVRFENLENQLAFASQYSELIRPAVGLHPKYCLNAPWEEREKLRELAIAHSAIAIGETGMEYNFDFSDEDYETQKKWFFYQIFLARELSLPLILHIRDSYQTVLEMLTDFKFPFGGVIHCFRHDWNMARAYIKLGYSLGIGGTLLQQTREGEILREVIRRVPLSSLLVETDSPYVLPDLSHVEGSSRQKQKLRNSSLILPLVIAEIARLQGEDIQTVENAILENTLRVFRLER